jgi:hypothetical protein
MTKSSAWVALQNPFFQETLDCQPDFRTWVAAHDTAAIWMMHVLTPSPFFPLADLDHGCDAVLFFSPLPAGALADMVDRKKVLCLMNAWLAAGAASLAILDQLHLLNPCTILVCVFLSGVGFAFNTPA